MNPRYPVYIPTKGRWESRLTIKAFDKIGVPFKAVIEEQEFDKYSEVVDPQKILIVPHQDKGLTVTRNWIWDHAQASGTPRFWTFDDNIREFYRLHKNIKYRVSSGTFLCVIEDFADRFANLPVAGMAYEMFVPRKQKHPPLVFNTRVYSNMLIQTDARDSKGKPFRNECFYNDDTDLCLRILKDGQCVVQFNAFLANKIATMRLKGGMTGYYQGDGRYRMAKELQEKHPDVTRIVWKFNRWQHEVDYSRFRGNQLILKPGVVITDEPNNYGMVLVKKD